MYLWNNNPDLEKSHYIPVSLVNQVLKCGTQFKGKNLIAKALQVLNYNNTVEHFFYEFHNDRDRVKKAPILETEKIIKFIKQSMELDIKDMAQQRVNLAYDVQRNRYVVTMVDGLTNKFHICFSNKIDSVKASFKQADEFKELIHVNFPNLFYQNGNLIIE